MHLELSVFLPLENTSKVFKLGTGVSGFALEQLLRSTGYVVELPKFHASFLKVEKTPMNRNDGL